MKTCGQCKWHGDKACCYVDPVVSSRVVGDPACSRFEPIEEAAPEPSNHTLMNAILSGDINTVAKHIVEGWAVCCVTEDKEPA